MDEKNKTEKDLNSCGSEKMTDKLLEFKKICDYRCSICNSGIMHNIHEWRKNGMDYDRIVEKARNEKSVKISPAGLSRHFKSYSAYKIKLSTEIIKNDVLEEITSQSVHIKRTVELLDIAYAKLKVMFESNLYKITVGDLEKLANMRYKILSGENLDNKELLGIFQKASDDYGLNLQQGVLFK